MADRNKTGIHKLEQRFRKLERRRLTEQDTSTKFIMPLLELLGWNIYDLDDLREKGYLDSSNQKKGLPDCVLFVRRKPYAVIEFKPVRFGTVDKEWVKSKILQQAENLDAKHAVITSFLWTKIYDSRTGSEEASFTIDGKCEYETKFERLWELLSKESALATKS